MSPAEARAQAEALRARLAEVDRIVTASGERVVPIGEAVARTERRRSERRAIRAAVQRIRRQIGMPRIVTVRDLPPVAMRPRVTARAVLQPIARGAP